MTANTAVHAVRQERDVRSRGPCAIHSAEIFAHGIAAQLDSYGMRHAQRRRQDPRWRRGRDRNVAPRTASPRGDQAATRGCRPHRPSRQALMPFRAARGRPAPKPAGGLSGPLASRLRGLRVQGFSATGACLLWAWFRRGLRPQGSARVAAPRSSANAHEDDGPDGRMREGKRHLCRPAERPTQRRSGREAMGSGLRCSWGPEAGWTFIANARMSWGGARLTALESGATRTVETVR